MTIPLLTMLLTLAATTPPQQTPVASLGTPAQRTDLRGGDAWRASVGAGGLVLPAEKTRWLSEPHRATCTVRLERALDSLLPGAALSLDAGYSPSAEGGMASLELATLAAGLTYYWVGDRRARSGLWAWLAPYARAAVSVSLLRVDLDALSQTSFLPGVAASLGARLYFGGDRLVRFFGFVEGGYALLLPRKLRLEQDSDDELIDGPPLRLGRADLSGALWTAGVGAAF